MTRGSPAGAGSYSAGFTGGRAVPAARIAGWSRLLQGWNHGRSAVPAARIARTLLARQTVEEMRVYLSVPLIRSAEVKVQRPVELKGGAAKMPFEYPPPDLAL